MTQISTEMASIHHFDDTRKIAYVNWASGIVILCARQNHLDLHIGSYYSGCLH